MCGVKLQTSMINFLKKLMRPIDMFSSAVEHKIPENEKTYHAMVAQSSGLTYMPLRADGLEVTINPVISDKRWVGGENNRIYPDIVLWRPNPSNPNIGAAIIVEQIETSSSINLNINNWKKLSELQNVNFILVIPLENVDYVLGILREQSIHPYRLQAYTYNQSSNNFTFTEVNQ
jgi:hypothetical protein